MASTNTLILMLILAQIADEREIEMSHRPIGGANNREHDDAIH